MAAYRTTIEVGLFAILAVTCGLVLFRRGEGTTLSTSEAPISSLRRTSTPAVHDSPDLQASKGYPTEISEEGRSIATPSYTVTAPEIGQFIKKTAVNDVGNRTPIAGLETFISAAMNGDIDKLAQLIKIRGDPDFKSYIDKFDAKARAEYDSQTKVAAVMVAQGFSDLSALEGYRFVASGAGGVVFDGYFRTENGVLVVGYYWLQEGADGWRVVVNPRDFHAFITGGKARMPYHLSSPPR